MKITLKINGENGSLMRTLEKDGFKTRLVKGGIIVELPVGMKSSQNSNPIPIFRIPRNIENCTFLINVEESGGGLTNTGVGTIVCGMSGKALFPYHVPKKGNLACGVHAYFAIPFKVVTISGSCKEDNISIWKHKIECSGDTVWIESELLWEGDLNELPDKYSNFQAGAKAARAKSNCYHCRCVHFAAEKN
jgi:hypothetical protein